MERQKLVVVGHVQPPVAMRKDGTAAFAHSQMKKDASRFFTKLYELAETDNIHCRMNLIVHSERKQEVQPKDSDLRIDFHLRPEPAMGGAIVEHLENTRSGILLLAAYDDFPDPEKAPWFPNLFRVGEGHRREGDTLYMPDKESFDRTKRRVLFRFLQTVNRTELQKLLARAVQYKKVS